MTTTFDWLSDLQPLFDAHESWLDGSYQKSQAGQLLCPADLPFSISCGSGLLAEHIRRFRFFPYVIQRLGRVSDEKGRSRFQESFLNHLQRMRLRVQVEAAPEGTLLLPGEPVLIARGTRLQLRLLDSAFRLLFWESTFWATQSALQYWQNDPGEEDAPAPPACGHHPAGWKIRATYIGGGQTTAVPAAPAYPGLTRIEHPSGRTLVQARRLYRGEQPLADAWFTSELEQAANVGRHYLNLTDLKNGKKHAVQMTRFQNLYQPVLMKGHPVLAEPSLGYLRQRTWKQLEAFRRLNLADYPVGWAASETSPL